MIKSLSTLWFFVPFVILLALLTSITLNGTTSLISMLLVLSIMAPFVFTSSSVFSVVLSVLGELLTFMPFGVVAVVVWAPYLLVRFIKLKISFSVSFLFIILGIALLQILLLFAFSVGTLVYTDVLTWRESILIFFSAHYGLPWVASSLFIFFSLNIWEEWFAKQIAKTTLTRSKHLR